MALFGARWNKKKLQIFDIPYFSLDIKLTCTDLENKLFFMGMLSYTFFKKKNNTTKQKKKRKTQIFMGIYVAYCKLL